jgi:hypothetical protein
MVNEMTAGDWVGFVVTGSALVTVIVATVASLIEEMLHARRDEKRSM